MEYKYRYALYVRVCVHVCLFVYLFPASEIHQLGILNRSISLLFIFLVQLLCGCSKGSETEPAKFLWLEWRHNSTRHNDTNARWLRPPSAGHQSLLPDGKWAAKASKGFGAGLSIGCKLSICCMAQVTAESFAVRKMNWTPSQFIPVPNHTRFVQPILLARYTRYSMWLFILPSTWRDKNQHWGGLWNQKGHAAVTAEKAYWQCLKHIGGIAIV